MSDFLGKVAFDAATNQPLRLALDVQETLQVYPEGEPGVLLRVTRDPGGGYHAVAEGGDRYKMVHGIDSRGSWVLVPHRRPGTTISEFPDHEFTPDMFVALRGLYTFRLLFGRQSRTSENKTDVALLVSPQLAKDMAAILMSEVQKYESENGTIPCRHSIDVSGVNIAEEGKLN